MNAYFFNISDEERKNILDKHKTLYDGYVVRGNNVPNEQPLYVQDFATDKKGLTLNNAGKVKEYTNRNINEQFKEKVDLGKSFGKMTKSIVNPKDHKKPKDNTFSIPVEKQQDSPEPTPKKEEGKEQYEKVHLLKNPKKKSMKKFKKSLKIEYIEPKNVDYENFITKDRIPYTADAVDRIIRMINGAKTKEHLASVMRMVGNLHSTNDDVVELYRHRINTAYKRKSEQLDDRLSDDELHDIIGGKMDPQFEGTKVGKSIGESLNWFARFKVFN